MSFIYLMQIDKSFKASSECASFWNLLPIFSHNCNNTTSKTSEEKFFFSFVWWVTTCVYFCVQKTTIIVFLSLEHSCKFPASKTRQDYQMRKTSSYHIMEKIVRWQKKTTKTLLLDQTFLENIQINFKEFSLDLFSGYSLQDNNRTTKMPYCLWLIYKFGIWYNLVI